MPSIKEMKATITRGGLPTADLLERADVEARYAEAQARLVEADRLRASRAPTPPPPRPPGEPAGHGPADRVPAPVLAHALGFLDDWRAIGRAAQTCRHWRGTVDDRVWRCALTNRWPRLEAVDPSALGSYPRSRVARDACVALGGAWAAPRRLSVLVFSPGPLEPEDGRRKVAAAFVLASTAPPLPANLTETSSTDAVEYVRCLVSAPANAPLLSSLGFWSSASGRRPRARRLNARATARQLEDIAHDITFADNDLSLPLNGNLWSEGFNMDHINVAEMSYLLGLTNFGDVISSANPWTHGNNAIGTTAFGDSIKDNWDIMYDENPGVTCYNRAVVCEALGTELSEGPLEEGEAHFFAGCDENHEPIGMGLAVYAFERDHARPGKAKTVAVFASEAG